MARQVYLHGRPLVRYTFFGSFPKKKRLDHESQKSGFRFDLKNPLEVWILWIHDPFLDFRNKTKNPFSDSRIRIWISPKKRTESVALNYWDDDTKSNYYKWYVLLILICITIFERC